jgi:hypothetical protein
MDVPESTAVRLPQPPNKFSLLPSSKARGTRVCISLYPWQTSAYIPRNLSIRM